MRLDTLTGPPAYVAAGFLVLALAAGCATRPKLGMEAPGRPAVTWQHETEDSPAAKPAAPAGRDTERALLAELREAEKAGTENLALATTLYNLAILRRQQGRFAEAEGLYQRALAIREREEGPKHPDVATTLNNLAALEATQGRYDAAQPLFERALTIRQTAFGGDHRLTAQSLNNLALLYAAQGNAVAAEPLYQRAVSILERTNTPPQDDLRRVLDNYAALLYETGRETEAEALEARARLMRAAPDR
jgi:tetratricopeptide (TPR) repeat protein